MVELGVVGRSIDPHFIDDLKPAVSKTSQGVGMALILLAMMLIVQLGPHAARKTLLGEKMHGMAQVFVTSPPGVNVPVFSSFTGALGYWCAASQALKVLWIAVEALTVIANFG